MKENKSKKISIIIILNILLIVIALNKIEFTLSNSELMHIAGNYQYEILDEKLRETYNELLGDSTLIVSKISANTLEEAQRLSVEYKNKWKYKKRLYSK